MRFENIKQKVAAGDNRWLVTGAAGFIGSHLVECLLRLEQRVVAIDNFSSGSHANLDAIAQSVGTERYASKLEFVEGDIGDLEACRRVCRDVDYVLHHAALSSVPLSIENPLDSYATNVGGSLNLMRASQLAGVKRFVYASSAAVYGDHPSLPHREAETGIQLSPYAVGKFACERFARNFFDCYQLPTIGLRYFNIFGPRQSAQNAYASVIPSFATDMLNHRPVQIFGDGDSSRDFCYIENVVQANLLAALTESSACFGQVFNLCSGRRISVLELYRSIRRYFEENRPRLPIHEPEFRQARPGDIRHSAGDVSKLTQMLAYKPAHDFAAGLKETLDWYLQNR